MRGRDRECVVCVVLPSLPDGKHTIRAVRGSLVTAMMGHLGRYLASMKAVLCVRR